MRQVYPSDISREQFESIRLSLENFKKVTCPRKVDLYDIYCAILYILKSGCQWRMLPTDYPKWSTVYFYFSLWTNKKKDEDGNILEKSLLEDCLKKCGEQISLKTK